MTDTDEDFATWAVWIAYVKTEPERFMPGGDADAIAARLVPYVYWARADKNADALLSELRNVFGSRFENFTRKERFIRRFVAGEVGFPTAEDYDQIARAARERLAGADFMERLAVAATRPDFPDDIKEALGEGPQVMGGVETPDDV